MALESQIELSKFNNSEVEIIYNNHVQKRTMEFDLAIETSFKDTIQMYKKATKGLCMEDLEENQN